MKLDTLALIIVACGAGIYLLAVFFGLAILSPISWPILIIFLLVVYIVYRVIRDRMENEEDDYYEKNIEE